MNNVEMNNEDIISEGFWYSKHAQHLPKVEARDKSFHEKGVILNLMFLLEERLMKMYTDNVKRYNEAYARWRSTPPAERAALKDMPLYEEGTKEVPVIGYRGSSTCRICGCHNGSKEYVYGGYRWPQGFRHYVEEHNVEPSEGFKKMLTDAAFSMAHPAVRYTIEAGVDGNVAGVNRMVDGDKIVALFINLRCKHASVTAAGSEMIDGKSVPIVYIDTLPSSEDDAGHDTGVVLLDYAGWTVWAAKEAKYGINVCLMRQGALYANEENQDEEV